MKDPIKSASEADGADISLPYQGQEMAPRKAKLGRPARRARTEEGGKWPTVLDLLGKGCDLKNGLPSEWSHLQILSHLLKTMRRECISSTVLQATLSLHFMRHEQVNLKDLAASLEIATPNITSVVDYLERIGFATRTACGKDRRQIHVALTPYGESFVTCVGELFATGPIAATQPSDPPSRTKTAGQKES